MEAFLAVEDVSVRYGDFTAVTDASLSLTAGRTLGVVGESGCGKSSLGLAIARLLPPGATIPSGTIVVGGVEMTALAGTELRKARGSVVAYIAQDALAALNPVVRAGHQVAEAVRLTGVPGKEAEARALSLLRRVGIQDEAAARRYPHELSGGMRQRVMIAMALALEPQLLIADEPTTALDTTVQAEILALVRELQREQGLTLVWITHDMGVVAEIADEMAVLYGGRVVERGPVASVFGAPGHPYTRALLESFREGARAEPKRPFSTIPGQPPAGELPGGCPFHPRCVSAFAPCDTKMPGAVAVAGGHMVSCHLHGGAT
jgi:oligopeptide/dipeptide ABC transporter ATP-binding protein